MPKTNKKSQQDETNRLSKKLNKYLHCLKELQFEVDKRQIFGASGDCSTFSGRRAVYQSPNLSHPKLLDEYTIRFCELEPLGRELIEDALLVRLRAYVPYSNFKVGAAFRSQCGQTFCGCNVENAAFTPGCCAERTALVKAVSEGHQEFVGGAVVAHSPDGFVAPCGVCRQFMIEFTGREDIPIYIARAPKQDNAMPMIMDEDEVLVTSVYRLQPHFFSKFK